MFIFEIEEKIDRLFNEVFPSSPFGDPRLNKRGYKPLLTEFLGFIVPDANTRRPIRDKEYFQVDQDDFLEFATSTLPNRLLKYLAPRSTSVPFQSLQIKQYC